MVRTCGDWGVAEGAFSSKFCVLQFCSASTWSREDILYCSRFQWKQQTIRFYFSTYTLSQTCWRCICFGDPIHFVTCSSKNNQLMLAFSNQVSCTSVTCGFVLKIDQIDLRQWWKLTSPNLWTFNQRCWQLRSSERLREMDTSILATDFTAKTARPDV